MAEAGTAFTSNARKKLFLEMAANAAVTPREVHRAACERGDTVTEEAYYNIARRLAHRGALVEQESSGVRRYIARQGQDHWLDEDDLWELVDPEYPLLALTIANESSRQMSEVSQEVWITLRDALSLQSAPELFVGAIRSYCQDFGDQVEMLVAVEAGQVQDDRGRRRREADVTHLLLRRMCKYGLGLSKQAVDLPVNVQAAVARCKAGEPVLPVDEHALQDEIQRRVADEPFVVSVSENQVEQQWLIGAVDGSTRGGVLSFLGEEGDLVSGHAPLVSINTAVGQVNRDVRRGNRTVPAFLRLPERPEDMQRDDNRYSVMAKLLYPDMSDGSYMHAVWNAMDLVESKAALRLMRNWSTPGTRLEVRAADVVLKDGTIAPQDRDFWHYAAVDEYGRIVREAILVNWEIAKHCRDDGQTFAGVVKEAQLSVFAPVVNWFAARELTRAVWPLDAMNLLPDQVVLTHLLTAGRRRSDPWIRSCITVRPFHAVTNFSESHSRLEAPSALVLNRWLEDMERAGQGQLDADRQYFWTELFRERHDPYVQMLDNVSYAAFYVGAVPRLDNKNRLPRIEFLVVASNSESDAFPWGHVEAHRDRLCSALQQNGFDVAAEHNMFEDRSKLDVLPSLLIKVHDTVKVWAADLLSRVQEFVGFYVARYVSWKRIRGLTIRPFHREEYRLLYEALKRERDLHAGPAPRVDRVADSERGLGYDDDPDSLVE